MNLTLLVGPRDMRASMKKMKGNKRITTVKEVEEDKKLVDSEKEDAEEDDDVPIKDNEGDDSIRDAKSTP